MTEEQWALEPHQVVFVDTSDRRDREYLRHVAPKGPRYVDTAGSYVFPLDEGHGGPWNSWEERHGSW